SLVSVIIYRCDVDRDALADFSFNVPASTYIYTLSLHDALPIYATPMMLAPRKRWRGMRAGTRTAGAGVSLRLVRAFCERFLATRDRKSTRLNSSHDQISYAVFCLKKKNNSRE